MTGNEYQAAIKRLGLSQVGAARFLGVNETTSRRWIRDKHPIPDVVVMLLRTMIAHRIPPDKVVRYKPVHTKPRRIAKEVP